MGRPELISVVIPCYNQARFLAEAIESVLQQTYPQVEIVVVDDGSVDNTTAIAGRYPAIRYVRQQNAGLPAARNTGIRQSTGEYLVFLDADDRLLPNALEAGLACFAAYPESAFVYGRHRHIAADGFVFAGWESYRPPAHEENDHYIELLRRCYISSIAAVLFRRTVLDAVDGFDESLPATEDYDLYLRITRRFPVRCHDVVVTDRRLHGSNMIRNHGLMISSGLGVLRSQRSHLHNCQDRRAAYRLGLQFWKGPRLGDEIVQQVHANMQDKKWRAAIQGLLVLTRHYPRGLRSLLYRLIAVDHFAR